jgi:hypothetical protein
MNTLRHRNGRFARSPVTPEQFRDRVGQHISRNFLSMEEATRRTELELRVRLAGDDIVETVDVRRWM